MDAGPKQDLWNLLPVIIALLLGAAYFAIMETAFSSASRIRLKAAADHGNRRAGQALYVLDHFDQAITTLLIGTNILHLTIATIVTVAVQRVWGMWAVTAATLVTTVVVFFAGEMLPKSIAKKYAERLAMATARSLRFFMVLFHPLSVLLTAIGNAAARCIRGEPAVTVTEDELADIIENMTDDGELTAERGELMSSALSFAEVPVESVITARVDVAAVDVDDPPEEILAYVREQRHSRLPVYADSVDNVIGILQIRKYIKACIKAGGKAVDIRPLLDEPVFVHQSTLIAEVLPELSRRKANLAIVTDNYGGTLGIVTVEDIVEELVGEIWDEDDVVEESFVPLGGGRYEVDAEMTVGEVFDRLDYTDPEDDEELRYKLLGEWTYEQFSYIPREREGFRYHRLDVRISDMRQKRIVKLIVRLLPEEPDEAAAAEAAPEKGGEPA